MSFTTGAPGSGGPGPQLHTNAFLMASQTNDGSEGIIQVPLLVLHPPCSLLWRTPPPPEPTSSFLDRTNLMHVFLECAVLVVDIVLLSQVRLSQGKGKPPTTEHFKKQTHQQLFSSVRFLTSPGVRGLQTHRLYRSAYPS